MKKILDGYLMIQDMENVFKQCSICLYKIIKKKLIGIFVAGRRYYEL